MANSVEKQDNRPYAVVLYGATSFVGQITAKYLSQFLADSNDVEWAIAGRDEEKLKKLQSEISDSGSAKKVDIIIANSNDEASLDEMTKQAKVVISTVGPYLKYGEPLIKSCANNGTDYVDLTGEAIFIKDMMDKYQDTAS